MQRGLVKELPLSTLHGTRLGVDATAYLKRLLSSHDPNNSDQFLSAVGGVPLALTAQIERDLKALEKAGVKPVFVFPGLAPQAKERPFVVEDQRTFRRHQAWEHYEQGRVQQAQAEFSQSSTLVPLDVIRIVQRLFKQRTVEFVVAPYLAWAQLVYLERHDKQYVHSSWASTELFLFDGIDRLILDINLQQSTFSYASKAAITHDLQISNDQFLDLSILAGFDGAPTFPIIEHNFSFRAAVDLIKTRASGVATVLSFRDVPILYQSNYMDQFARARTMIKFALVLVAQDGRVLPLPLVIAPPIGSGTAVATGADVPVDLNEVYSARFPDEVYYQLFRGLVGPQLLTALASGHVSEPAPLCGGTPEYERFIKSLTEAPQSPRCVALALISSVLHPLWSKKPVAAIYYFDPTRDYLVPHSSGRTTEFIGLVSKWNVDARHVEDELRRQSSSTIDLCLCLGGTSTPSLAQRTIVPRNSDKLLDKKDEIVANTLWRFLELRTFLTAAHQHTPHAVALFAAMKASKVNDKFQEALYLAIELLQAGVLYNGRIGTRPYSGGPNFQGSEEDKRSMLLVMRVMSIVPLSFHPGPWTGPLSRELLVFNSFLRATSRAMRQLLESVALNLLLRSDARRSREDYLDIALSLPFQSETNTGMGILFKAYGDAVCHLAGGVDVVRRAGAPDGPAPEGEKHAVSEAKEQTLGLLDGAFPNVKNVRGELARGLRFWQVVSTPFRPWCEVIEGRVAVADYRAWNGSCAQMMVAVRSLRGSQGGIAPGLAAQFEAADKWLHPFQLGA